MVLCLQRAAGHIAAEIESSRRREDATPAEIVIDEEPEAKEPSGPLSRVMGQDETDRPDDVRRSLEEDFAFREGLMHESEFVELEISKAAVDELG
jgi:hypothetical protein